VPATDLALFEYLEQRFKGDPATSVLVERRKIPRPAPRAVVLMQGVTVVRLGDPPQFMTPLISPRPDDRRQTMSEIDLEDRQRVDRWLEESQYLLGRLIPGYLDERERLKTRLAGSEADCDRLRHELEGLRREVASLVAELQHHRNEQASTAEAFAAVLGQLSDLQKPLNEVHRRLQSVHAPVMNGVYSHA
jgi:DNA repair exonuclease SbcCD ATPase subunit